MKSMLPGENISNTVDILVLSTLLIFIIDFLIEIDDILKYIQILVNMSVIKCGISIINGLMR